MINTALVWSSANSGHPHCSIQVPGKLTGNGPDLFQFILLSLHLIFHSSSTIPSFSFF